MLRRNDGSVLYSPSDLIRFLAGDFAAWMDRLHFEDPARCPAEPDESSEEDELARRYGDEHERRYLERMREGGVTVVEIPRGGDGPARTDEALLSGADVIYQAVLEDGVFQGYADFLRRTDGGSRLGGWHYTPWDTKLARRAKPYHLVQLCAYAWMLAARQGRWPERIGVILGTGDEVSFPVKEFRWYFRRLRSAFLDFQAAFDPDPARRPNPALEREFGRWAEYAERLLEEMDHPARVANITRSQIVRLEQAGITTMTALARSSGPVPRIQPATLARLRRQADLQLRSAGQAVPLYEVIPPPAHEPRRGLALLPPPSDGDVYLDLEGFPYAEGGLEYLFGAVVVENGEAVFHDWWAHDEIEEKRALEAFVDWLHARWRRDPSMHVYHYAGYETGALRRLMGKYATREAEVDDLLRHEVFVDLLTVVRQGVAIGTPSYSLKDIERLYLPPRAGGVTTAAGSVVAYQRWIDSGEPRDWRQSPILREIRDYNEADCRSTWRLAGWLRDLQASAGIAYIAPAAAEARQQKKEEVPAREAEVLADRMLRAVETARAAGATDADAERLRVQELLAWLLGYHRREDKPVWWKMFDCAKKAEEELYDDPDCLAGLARTATPPVRDKRSWICELAFDPDQDTRFGADDTCRFAHDVNRGATITALDPDAGIARIRTTVEPEELPDPVSLIPGGPVNSDSLARAVYRYASAWMAGTNGFRAVDDLLHRRPPRIAGHPGGTLIAEDRDLVEQVADLVAAMDETTLCIQGPPGTGKTWTTAAVICRLVREGRRVGVTATGHAAIDNVLEAVTRAAAAAGISVRRVKVGGNGEALEALGVECVSSGRELAGALGTGGVVVGATAWGFAPPELEGAFDWMFVDEAGQFALANTVVVGLAGRNLVLVGDQMQLPQPTQGAHPGESGLSGLEYLLAGHATIPPDFGVLLNVTYRLHPEICGWVSDAIYEGRLRPAPANAARRIAVPPAARRVRREAGIVYVPVEHEGNVQSSVQEAEVICEIVAELLGREMHDERGNVRPLELGDILFVAPYNAQVRRLRERLPGARVGSVDKFQGQEAPVVIVSMCASSLEEVTRGADFLLSPNRLNVAVSRARSLAIVVASPGLLAPRCRSIDEMRLVNLHCWLEEYAGTRSR